MYLVALYRNACSMSGFAVCQYIDFGVNSIIDVRKTFSVRIIVLLSTMETEHKMLRL